MWCDVTALMRKCSILHDECADAELSPFSSQSKMKNKALMLDDAMDISGMSPTTRQAHDMALELQVREKRQAPCRRACGDVDVRSLVSKDAGAPRRFLWCHRTLLGGAGGAGTRACSTAFSQMRLSMQHDLPAGPRPGNSRPRTPTLSLHERTSSRVSKHGSSKNWGSPPGGSPVAGGSSPGEPSGLTEQ